MFSRLSHFPTASTSSDTISPAFAIDSRASSLYLYCQNWLVEGACS